METIKSHQMHNRRLGGLSPFNPEKGRVRKRKQVIIGGVSSLSDIPPRRRRQAKSSSDLNRIGYQPTGLSIANTNQPNRAVLLLGGVATTVSAFGRRVTDFFNKASERKRTLVPLSFIPVFFGAFSTLAILGMFTSSMETAKTNASDERISIQASARTFMSEGTGRDVKSDGTDDASSSTNPATTNTGSGSGWTSQETRSAGTINSFTGESSTPTTTAPVPATSPVQTTPTPAVTEPTSPTIIPDLTEPLPIVDPLLNQTDAEGPDPLIEVGPIDLL